MLCTCYDLYHDFPHLFSIGSIQNSCAIPDPRKNVAIAGFPSTLGNTSGIYRCTIPAIAVATAAAKK